MAHRPTPHGRNQAVVRLFPVLALLLVAAMLIWPSGDVRGGPAKPHTAGETARFQATPGAEPAPEAPSTAQDGSGDESSQDPAPAARLAPEDQSGIFLNKFQCADVYDGELPTLLANCPVSSNVTFEIFGPNLQLTSTGGIALERLPAGLYRIRESLPAGYSDPIAYCGVGPTNDQLPLMTEVIVYDGYYEFELGASQSIYCNWFNVDPQAPRTATLYLNKHFCPPAAEFDAAAATIYDLAAACQAPGPPVTFDVMQNDVRIGGGATTGTPALLVLSALPVGPATIVETVPEGYGEPLVFCSVRDELGADRAPLAQAQVDNDRAFWVLYAGDVVFCDWFNVPAPLGTSISVVKFICPPASGAPRQSYDEYAAACTEPGAGVSFKLDGARTGNPGEQLTDANGQITWSEMEADRYFLTEEVPAGFGPPAAFCSYYDPAAIQTRVYDAYPVSADNRIEFDLADGQFIACSWFNTPGTPDSSPPEAPPGPSTPTSEPGASPSEPATATTAAQTATAGAPVATGRPEDGQPGAGSVTAGQAPASAAATLRIRAYRCQPDYDYLAPEANPVVDCPDLADSLSFELSSFAATGAQDRRRPNLGGVDATFSPVTPGTYRLIALNASPEGAAFIRSCQSDRRRFEDYPFDPFAVVASDGSVRLSLVGGETLICDWYEVPAGSA